MADGWVPAFPGQRPPFVLGDPRAGRTPAHGAYSVERLTPLASAIEEHLAEASPAFAESDDHARRLLSNQLARCELVYRWLDEHGIFDDKGRPQPVLGDLAKWESAARKQLREMGMTTLSRAELRLDQAQEMVAYAELVEAIERAFELALRYVPRERQREYLAEVQEAFEAQDRAAKDGDETVAELEA